MNKKFSTLLVSALLAGSMVTPVFAENENGGGSGAAAKTDYEAKAGDNVLITKAAESKAGTGAVLSLNDGVLEGKDWSELITENKLASGVDFADVNAAMWRVAEVKVAPVTGAKSYRFANKATGEYLALELVTTEADHTSAKAAKLDASGNSEWAYDGGVLFAFDGDSVFYLNTNMGLNSVPAASFDAENAAGAAKLTLELPSTEYIVLTADNFNDLMALPGNNGMLNFATKGIEVEEGNVFEDNKWEATEWSSNWKNVLFLSNGEKVKGGDNKDNYKYLVVDTTYLSADTTLLGLAVDTLNFGVEEPGGIYGDKNLYTPEKKGYPYKTGAWMVRYYLGADSLVLNALYMPKRDEVVRPGRTSDGLDTWALDQVIKRDGSETDWNCKGQVTLSKLSKTYVYTVTNAEETGDYVGAVEAQKAYIAPLLKPYSTLAGTADIDVDKLYNISVVSEDEDINGLFAAALYHGNNVAEAGEGLVEAVDAYIPAHQWGFYASSEEGNYQLVNRATGKVVYAGPVDNALDEDGKAIKDTYVIYDDTVMLTEVVLPNEHYTFKEESGSFEKGSTWDTYGYFWTIGEENVDKTYRISSTSPYLKELYLQALTDSSIVLDKSQAVWNIVPVGKEKYGAEIEGINNLIRQTYKLALTDGDDTYYVVADVDENVFVLTHSTSGKADKFYIKNVAEGEYVIYNDNDEAKKMTVNAQVEQPIIEASDLDSEKYDYFTITTEANDQYRRLGVTVAEDGFEDGKIGNALIYRTNVEDTYLYENTMNRNANNGKACYNFLGEVNLANQPETAELPIAIIPAYVTEETTKPLYMLAVRDELVEATEGVVCPVHGADCEHTTLGEDGYRKGAYLVSLADSAYAKNENLAQVKYQGATRLAFVDAIHVGDSLIISSSKFTGTKENAADTLAIADEKGNATPNEATFAFKLVDPTDDAGDFYLQLGAQYVRIHNSVPVLVDNIAEAATFNIEATEEEAVANDAIEAAAVKVIATEGAVIVKGAAGKAIVIANVLGQTVANTVATSDEVTIAAPAGVVVVAVEGEDAVKAIVK